MYQSGQIGGQFTAALEAAARRGVDVRMVLDSIGASKTSEEHIERLRRAGAQVAWFNKVSGLNFEELNYRPRDRPGPSWCGADRKGAPAR